MKNRRNGQRISRIGIFNVDLSFVVRCAIVLYLFAVFFSESSGTLLVQAARVVVFGVGVFYAVLYFITSKDTFKKEVRIPFFYLWGFVLFVYFILQIAFDGVLDKERSFCYWLTTLYVFLVDAVIIFYLERNREQLSFVLKAFIMFAVASAAYIFIRYGFDYFLHGRVTEFFNSNSISLRLTYAAAFAFYVALKESDKLIKKVLYYALSIACIGLMLLGASRKAYILIVITAVVYLLFSGKSILKSFRNLVIIALVLVGIYLALTKIDFLYETIGSRFEAMISGFEGGETDSSTASRLHLIDNGWAYFNERPVFGYGLDGFRYLQNINYSGTVAYYSHNNFIEMLVNGGVVGTVIYYSLYLMILIFGLIKLLGKGRSKPVAIFFGLFVACFVGEYGMVTYYDMTQQFVIMLCYFVLCYKETDRSVYLR